MNELLKLCFTFGKSTSTYRVDWASFLFLFSDGSNDEFVEDFMFKIGMFHCKCLLSSNFDSNERVK